MLFETKSMFIFNFTVPVFIFIIIAYMLTNWLTNSFQTGRDLPDHTLETGIDLDGMRGFGLFFKNAVLY